MADHIASALVEFDPRKPFPTVDLYVNTVRFKQAIDFSASLFSKGAGNSFLFSVFPMAVFRFIYSPAIGTVPGAVATGSVAPGRYRSRYRTGGHFHVRAIAS